MSPEERDRLIRDVDAVLELAQRRYQEAVDAHGEARKAIELLWRVAGKEASPSAPISKPGHQATALAAASLPEPAESEPEGAASSGVKARVLGALAAFEQETFSSVDVLSLIENDLPGQDRNAKLNRVSTALRRLAKKEGVITLAFKGKAGEAVQYRKITKGGITEA